jgi:hypothetical protein
MTGFECGTCNGHFIRAAALSKFFGKHDLPDRFAALTSSVRDAPVSPRNLSCSECRASDFRVLRAGIVELDACAGCTSLYFDADEATQYLRQTRYKAVGGKAAETAITGVDGVGAIIEFLTAFIH